jgi:hypothetical protein
MEVNAVDISANRLVWACNYQTWKAMKLSVEINNQ